MIKDFYEVFPSLSLKGELGSLLGTVKVYRITQSRDKKFISVYIKSNYLILKKDIKELEKEMASQLFKGAGIGIRIYESFELSSQYTAERLMEEYKSSIELELKFYNPIMERIFSNGEISFETDDYDTAELIVLKVEDTIVSRSLEKELIRILEKIFNERCGIPAAFRFDYVEPVKSRSSEIADLRVLEEARQISDRVRGREETQTEASGTAENAGNAKASGTENGRERYAQKSSGQKKGKSFKGFEKYSDDPDVVYGRDMADEPIVDICYLEEEPSESVIHGKVLFCEERETRKGSIIYTFHISDFTDTISVKLFIEKEQLPEIRAAIHEGAFLKVKGTPDEDKFDHELTLGRIRGIRKIPDFTVERMDNCPIKRVELHCHTKMSEMDGVSEVKDIIKRAKKWGHKALAITDHGVVQAFTEAFHTIDKKDDFKLIYGVEGYLVDDEKKMVISPEGQRLSDTYVVFDIETTGFSPVKDAIIEIGAVKISEGKIVDRFSSFVNPKRPIPFRITNLTSINDIMVKDSPGIEGVLPDFLDFAAGSVLVAHNAGFDTSFIRENAARLGRECSFTILDTVALSRFLIPEISKYKLDNVAKALGVILEHHHRAVDDAECTARILLKLFERLKKQGIEDMDALSQINTSTVSIIQKLPAYHIIILAKNEIGRVNLYRLISDSHLKYFKRVPRIPRSELIKYREGLIIGSACEAGELFRAIMDGRSNEEIAEIVSFYDYLEIQPIGNNDFLRREGKVEDEEGLRDLNREIVSLGERFNKPVCATCDVHFLDPQDEVYRRIIMANKGFDDADEQAPLYLHTTEEMLQEFSYLGTAKAEEVVVTNTNFIADQIDRIPPVRPDKCPPVIENSDQTLRDICYERAKEIYGDPIPKPVMERLERELHSIISNGFAVMYIIAQKLVWKSNEDGYLVGSRGSVGSSLVAYLAGITEVNSLSPHYYCPDCYFNDFDSEDVKKFAGMAGCDMPDKECPNCHKPLKKDGFDIPFETFLGFKGDKEPDIDLNFSGDYQAKAHKYTEVIFGEGHTFKAGTVGTVADKTAYGYVKSYFEKRNVIKRRCEIERIAAGCTGVKRTTGQHPGGIIVLPHGEEIYSFTPVQHPANDMTSDIITTHFDYHSIDHNLLKLDILGHDDPTMIRFLQDATGVDPKDIPLDDRQVMSLFQNTEALGIKPEDIDGCKLGALGIPEFGTDFAMGMLLDTKPQYFSDLVRIAGLSHGTDVWLGNAETLIKEGTATISTAICTRDDIMIYLIQMGVEPSHAFSIMENVRKGKVAKGKCKEWDGWKEELREHQVPEWYIWSCEKIQYMFPKAHAAAYVMMAWRIAWCKINYPLAYYAAFFSIRAADDFSYELMCLGQAVLEHHIADYKARQDTLTPKEAGQLKVMRLVQEMYARGFEFWPIDIKKADARYFKEIDGKLMPSISSIDGVGINAAEAIVAAAADGEPFSSRENFRERSGVSKTIAEQMGALGLLGDIPENDQLSIFDFM